jgi:hypothetical protein
LFKLLFFINSIETAYSAVFLRGASPVCFVIVLFLQFNPRTPISKDDRFYRENPQYKHQAHCVVFVVDGNAIQQHMPRNFSKKIKEMQEEIRRLRKLMHCAYYHIQ